MVPKYTFCEQVSESIFPKARENSGFLRFHSAKQIGRNRIKTDPIHLCLYVKKNTNGTFIISEH
ncbi:hypothetical protein [Leptospira mtsangambouensis]|uniref:hypothetical protein n=1 Tax=Leptospira mtsangambouensis TaxID=2484912 RepID=UPI001EEB0C3E|nr:hypothetical protein [Leptospira mtsangambouensis]MCG6141397.1 hypothetical protein [Leptospira mtsangambouensis]